MNIIIIKGIYIAQVRKGHKYARHQNMTPVFILLLITLTLAVFSWIMVLRNFRVVVSTAVDKTEWFCVGLYVVCNRCANICK